MQYFRASVLSACLLGLAMGCNCWGIPDGEPPIGKIVQIADSASPKSVTAAREYFIVAFCPVVLQFPYPVKLGVAEGTALQTETELLVAALAKMVGGNVCSCADGNDCLIFRSRLEDDSCWVLELLDETGQIQYSARQQIK